MQRISQYRVGRNFIRVGDVVRVKPSQGKRDGFEAKVRVIRADEITGEVAEVEVFGGRRRHAMIRTFRPERIQRRPGAGSRVRPDDRLAGVPARERGEEIR